MFRVNTALQMAPAYILPFIATFATLFMSLLFFLMWILSRNKSHRIARETFLMFLMSFLMCLFDSAQTITALIQSKRMLIFIYQSQLAIFAFIIYLFVSILEQVTEDDHNSWSRLYKNGALIAVIVLFALSLFSNLFVTGKVELIKTMDEKWLYAAQRSLFFFIIYIPVVSFFAFFSGFRVIKHFHELVVRNKIRAVFIFFGTLFALVGGLLEILSGLSQSLFMFRGLLAFWLSLSSVSFGFATLHILVGQEKNIEQKKSFMKQIFNELNELNKGFDTITQSVSRVTEQLVARSVSMNEMLSQSRLSVEQLMDLSSQGKKSTENVIDIVDKNIHVFNDISEKMAKQTSSVIIIEKQLTELNNAVQEVGKNSENMAQIIAELSEDIQNGKNVLQTNKESMDTIKQSVEQVASIVDIISDISEQINILAINASIEAAHAGEKGRGFSVVAQEIRAVSVTTLEQSFGIDNRIHDIVRETDEAEKYVQSIDEIFTDFSQNSDELLGYIKGVLKTAGDLGSKITMIMQDMNFLKKQAFENNERSFRESKRNSELMEKIRSVQEYIVGIVKEVNEEKGDVEKLIHAMDSINAYSENNIKIIRQLDTIQNDISGNLSSETLR